jgi:hypothetical protein
MWDEIGKFFVELKAKSASLPETKTNEPVGEAAHA